MSNRNNYANIKNIGPSVSNDAVNDPVSYCINNTIDVSFQHGSNKFGQHCLPCQVYMSKKCADNWDDVCEYISNNTNTSFPNNLQNSSKINETVNKNMNAGEILIRNTFSNKYLAEIYNTNQITEPFDPLVPSSPLISYYKGDKTLRVYNIPDVTLIDDDIVMNKVLDNPNIALDILDNIYNTMKRNGTLPSLQGTRLGYYFTTNKIFINKGGLI